MSNGYLVAAWPDLAAARDISVGFGLDVIDAGTVPDPHALADMLVRASNVGLLISATAAQDSRFVALMRVLGARLATPQLILADKNAHAPFSFLPQQWPAMLLDDARERAARRRQAMPPPTPPAQQQGAGSLEDLLNNVARPAPGAPPPVQQPPPAQAPSSGDALGDLLRSVAKPDPEPAPETAPAPEIAAEPELQAEPTPDPQPDLPPDPQPDPQTGPQPDPLGELLGGVAEPDPPHAPAPEPEPASDHAEAAPEPEFQAAPAPLEAAAPPPPVEAPVLAPAPAQEESRALARRRASAEPPPQSEAPEAPPPPTPEPPRGDEAEFAPLDVRSAAPVPHAPRASAPADATAFAPKKLRRGTPELLRVVIHQPRQLREVIKAAKKIDPNARPAPQGISIGDIALGANVGIALEAHGASCQGALQRRSWAGEPIDFAFPIEAEDGAKQAVFLARVFVDDAQIGVIAFTRPIVSDSKEAKPEEVRLTRHKRVFISYSSADRETVALIATAYEMAGVAHFWDRTSLKSGEEWSPRLKKEIEQADLFHLCWSQAAAQSQWVAKEAEHALKRRRGRKRPEITVQMLDGPPWAPHPPELDAINFDDFVRAAIVGYARGQA